MGCFLGCFGGEKNHKRRKHRINRGSSRAQRVRVQNVQQETKITAEQFITETPPIDLVSELRGCRNKPEGEEQQLQLSPSSRKRVTFNSNVKTYVHVSAQESIDSLPEFNIEKEKKNLKSPQSLSEDDNSVISSVGSYPPNHRYHNAGDSDYESEEYGYSDLEEELEEDLDDDEDDYDDSDEDIDVKTAGQEVWSESVESFEPKTNVRDRCEYVNSVLNPVENISQWKAAKSKGTHALKPQKENLTANIEPPSFTSEPTFRQVPKSDPLKGRNQEMAINSSFSNWLVTPEIPITKNVISEGSSSVRSAEDRPILGAWTVDELRQISASSSPKKSPSRSPGEMLVICTVGTYWNHPSSSYEGIPNTTSKYRGMHEMRLV